MTSLIPPIHKHTFAPEVGPSGLVDDEAEFEALKNIDWSSSTFQEKEQSGSAVKLSLRVNTWCKKQCKLFGLNKSCNKVEITLLWPCHRACFDA